MVDKQIIEASKVLYKQEEKYFVDNIATNIANGLEQANNGNLIDINDSKSDLKNKLFGSYEKI